MPLVEINDFNALIDNKPFLGQPRKNKQKGQHKYYLEIVYHLLNV